MSAVTKVFGVAGVVTGVLAAAALGGVTAQRVALRKLRSGEVGGDTDFDALPVDRSYSVIAEDGVVLQVEEVGPIDAPLTIVFAHGWALRLGSWHFQRIGLSADAYGTRGVAEMLTTEPDPQDAVRMVFYDMRSHGRSTRPTDGRPTLDQLAGDLATVIATAASDGPLVLIGHSMGGMALLSLAGLQPELFADRVLGVGLISTSAVERSAEGSGFRFHRAGPVVKVASVIATRYSGLIERGRASTRDAAWLLTRMLGFAGKDVPAPVVDYLDEMLTGTAVDVITDFIPGLLAYDRVSALPALAGIPTLVLCGDADRITPPAGARLIADALLEVEYVELPKVGHVPLMETPEVTTDALRRLLVRARAYAATHADQASR